MDIPDELPIRFFYEGKLVIPTVDLRDVCVVPRVGEVVWAPDETQAYRVEAVNYYYSERPFVTRRARLSAVIVTVSLL
jgi:hypothetical protein